MSANITSGAAIASADLLTDLKSGYLLGAHPRKQFLAQFFRNFHGHGRNGPGLSVSRLPPHRARFHHFSSQPRRRGGSWRSRSARASPALGAAECLVHHHRRDRGRPAHSSAALVSARGKVDAFGLGRGALPDVPLVLRAPLLPGRPGAWLMEKVPGEGQPLQFPGRGGRHRRRLAGGRRAHLLPEYPGRMAPADGALTAPNVTGIPG